MKRIQRRRSAGWRMPPGTVYVGRPTRFGNPYPADGPGGRAAAVTAYAAYLAARPDLIAQAREQLTGHDLACWCPLSEACHADVLLQLLTDDPAAGGQSDTESGVSGRSTSRSTAAASISPA
jgi:hypothetical protein